MPVPIPIVTTSMAAACIHPILRCSGPDCFTVSGLSDIRWRKPCQALRVSIEPANDRPLHSSQISRRCSEYFLFAPPAAIHRSVSEDSSALACPAIYLASRISMLLSVLFLFNKAITRKLIEEEILQVRYEVASALYPSVLPLS